MYQYQQLANALKEEILREIYKRDKLPSVRELVATYGAIRIPYKEPCVV